MNLTNQEKEQIKETIDGGEALPPKYKLMPFVDAPEVELVWQGKEQRSDQRRAAVPEHRAD